MLDFNYADALKAADAVMQHPAMAVAFWIAITSVVLDGMTARRKVRRERKRAEELRETGRAMETVIDALAEQRDDLTKRVESLTGIVGENLAALGASAVETDRLRSEAFDANEELRVATTALNRIANSASIDKAREIASFTLEISPVRSA